MQIHKRERRSCSFTATPYSLGSSFDPARQTLIDWGINITVKRVERLIYCFAKIGLSLRESKIFNLSIDNLLPGNMLKGQRVVIAADQGYFILNVNRIW